MSLAYYSADHNQGYFPEITTSKNSKINIFPFYITMYEQKKVHLLKQDRNVSLHLVLDIN